MTIARDGIIWDCCSIYPTSAAIGSVQVSAVTLNGSGYTLHRF